MSKQLFVSYAQNFEDVILWRALKHVKKGFYIDIGAQDPMVDSVSLAFYQHGWRGVHVEPNSDYAEKLQLARPDEEVLHVAVGCQKGKIKFFEFAGNGLSTGKLEVARQYKTTVFSVREAQVNCLSLAKLLDTYKEREIHWLKIDVVGMEEDVLQSWLPSDKRPWIVVVESIAPGTQVETYEKWNHLLVERGYDFVYFDGLNRFYVSQAHLELKKTFGPGPNIFDQFVLSGTTSRDFCYLMNSRLDVQYAEKQALVRNFEMSYYEKLWHVIHWIRSRGWGRKKVKNFLLRRK